MQQKSFVFGVDLDGVVADFIEGLRPIAADWLGVKENELTREVSYGIPYWDLCFMKDKAAVGADLYIEDSPANIQALRAARCEVICFGNSTNRDVTPPRVTSWAQVEELVRAKLEQWRRPLVTI